MNDKAKYIIYSLLDFGLTFGGTAGVIVYNYITPDNSLGFKLTLSGIVLVVALLLTAKTIFERKFREKYDMLLQQIATATTTEQKTAIGKELEKHKLKNNIYQRLTLLLPFAVLYVVTWLGAISLDKLNGTVGLILATMGVGSVFNVIKKPVGEKVSLAKTLKKAKRK